MKDIFRLVTSAGQRKIIVLAQWVKDLATIIYISRKKKKKPQNYKNEILEQIDGQS